LNPLITDVCADVIEFSDDEIDKVSYVYSLIAQTSSLNFQLIVSILIVLYATIMIMMLQRTQKLGELIMMVAQMVSELRKWLLTFGLLIILFILLGRQLNEILKIEKSSFFEVF
jgi:phosphatidylglycerophosphate synthase